MTNPSYTQVGFRGRNDNGSESSATWKANENVNWSQNVAENFRVRFRIDETVPRLWTNKTFNLYYSVGAGYNPVSGTTPVRFALSSNFNDNDDCTQQLTGGTGTFLVNNNGMKEATGGSVNTGAGGEIWDTEWCLTIDPAQVADGNTITLRIYDGASAITTYSNTPSITVVERSFSVSDAVTVGDSATVQVEAPVITDREINTSDAVALAESSKVELESLVSASEAVAVTDTVRYYQEHINVSEFVLVEVEALIGDLDISVSDSVAVADSAQIEPLTLDISALEAVALAEAQQLDISIEISRSEAVAVAEAVTTVVSGPEILISDAVSITDTASVTIPVAGQIEINISDNVTISDATTIAPLEINASASEAVSVGEAQTLDIPINIFASDAVSVTDTASIALPDALAISQTESIAVAEAVTISSALETPSIFVTDNVSVTDNAIMAFAGTLVIEASEAISVTDVLQAFVPAGVGHRVFVRFEDRRAYVDFENRRHYVRFEDRRVYQEKHDE